MNLQCYDEDFVTELCRICEKRRPRRYCPGIHGDICSQCCGEERENTVDCPFDCSYLMEARRHEKPPDLTPEDIPNKDIRVTEGFLRDREPLVLATGRIVFEAGVQVPGAVDSDVREALESLIQTYRTLETGLIYESRPANPIAAGVQQIFDQRMQAFREAATQQAGMSVIRDSEILGVLAFLQRLALQHNNGRRKGRAFLDMLRGFLPPEPPPAASNLVA
jgi:hypothetical protein